MFFLRKMLYNIQRGAEEGGFRMEELFNTHKMDPIVGTGNESGQ